MLYRGSEIMREVAWVVFDEIHYMRDAGLCSVLFWFNKIITCVNTFIPSHGGVCCRAWCGVGGNHHSSSRQCALRLPVSHHPQRQTVRRVDLPPT